MSTNNTPTGILCHCGCGASWAGWSDVGKRHGLRNGVPRVYVEPHGTCDHCGQPLDQYQECRNHHSSGHQVPKILSTYDPATGNALRRTATANSSCHFCGQTMRHGTCAECG